jgi:hypothetical protein
MPRRMNRGKQQVLLNYLPERTFDFEKIGTIARVSRVRGFPRSDLNLPLVLRAIQEQLDVWQPAYRPVLQNLTTAADRLYCWNREVSMLVCIRSLSGVRLITADMSSFDGKTLRERLTVRDAARQGHYDRCDLLRCIVVAQSSRSHHLSVNNAITLGIWRSAHGVVKR